MNINEILDQMSHDITALTFGEKMLGGLAVTALSMAIVFLVLVLLIGIIKAMDSMVNPKSKQENEESNEFLLSHYANDISVCDECIKRCHDG